MSTPTNTSNTATNTATNARPLFVGSLADYDNQSSAAVHELQAARSAAETSLRSALLVSRSCPAYDSVTKLFGASYDFSKTSARRGGASPAKPTLPTVLHLCIPHLLSLCSEPAAEPLTQAKAPAEYELNFCKVGEFPPDDELTDSEAKPLLLIHLVRISLLFANGRADVVLLDAQQPCARQALEDWMRAGAIPVVLQRGDQHLTMVLPLTSSQRQELLLILEHSAEPSELMLEFMTLNLDDMLPDFPDVVMTAHIATAPAGWLAVETAITKAQSLALHH